VEELVNGWWIGGEGRLSVDRIGGKGGRCETVAEFYKKVYNFV
jgi:hypothetical protein